MPAFLSYSRKDNERAECKISEFATLLEEEIQQSTGNSEFRIYVDNTQHEWGVNWRKCIESGIEEAVVFIAVMSPTYFKRPECIKELEQFLSKQDRVLKARRVGSAQPTDLACCVSTSTGAHAIAPAVSRMRRRTNV